MINSIAIDYNDFCNEYKENPDKANRKYNGSNLILTSEIDSISKGNNGIYHAIFKISKMQNIQLYFDKSENDKVAKLKGGQTIKIVGKYVGDQPVILSDCLLV
jgi:hypothetical protein